MSLRVIGIFLILIGAYLAVSFSPAYIGAIVLIVGAALTIKKM